MAIFAAAIVHPGDLVAWLVVGVVAGWFAGFVMKDRRNALLADLGAGVVGAVLGGFVAGLVIPDDSEFLGRVGIAFLAAWTLIVLLRYAAWTRTR